MSVQTRLRRNTYGSSAGKSTISLWRNRSTQPSIQIPSCNRFRIQCIPYTTRKAHRTVLKVCCLKHLSAKQYIFMPLLFCNLCTIWKLLVSVPPDTKQWSFSSSRQVDSSFSQLKWGLSVVKRTWLWSVRHPESYPEWSTVACSKLTLYLLFTLEVTRQNLIQTVIYRFEIYTGK